MRVYNIKEYFLPNKVIYNMLYVSNYTIYKQRKDVKMHPEYDSNPVLYVKSVFDVYCIQYICFLNNLVDPYL